MKIFLDTADIEEIRTAARWCVLDGVTTNPSLFAKTRGKTYDEVLVEIVELRDHPWFVASQFHPEFRSRPDRPHPLFMGFVEAAISHAAVSTGAGREPEALAVSG